MYENTYLEFRLASAQNVFSVYYVTLVLYKALYNTIQLSLLLHHLSYCLSITFSLCKKKCETPPKHFTYLIDDVAQPKLMCCVAIYE